MIFIWEETMTASNTFFLYNKSCGYIPIQMCLIKNLWKLHMN